MLCACAIAGSASPTDAVASNRVQAMCRMLIPDMSDLLDEHDEARTEPQPRCGAGRPADHDLNSWPRTDRCNAMPSPVAGRIRTYGPNGPGSVFGCVLPIIGAFRPQGAFVTGALV